MKQLVFSLFPEAIQYRGHWEYFNQFAFEIAKYNGESSDNDNADKFIDELVTGTGITLEKINPATYQIGHQKHIRGKYIVYGTITKVYIH